uniref:Uncharacterized protein n=1 Tax=Nicotiana tabacum TaxID=4097 RepID=A0A1S4AZB5_TOBAC|nr:PREDICTED: uncharacterized protein LOC107802936 [Nicotiana tabacum]
MTGIMNGTPVTLLYVQWTCLVKQIFPSLRSGILHVSFLLFTAPIFENSDSFSNFVSFWFFVATMRDVELIPDFRGWVDSILKIAPKDQRTWKSISSLHGWKVKTHGFGVRGMTGEVVMAIRMSANVALDLNKARASLPKRKAIGEGW